MSIWTPSHPGRFANAAKRLFKYKDDPNFGYIFNTLGKLSQLLAVKCDISVRARRPTKGRQGHTCRACESDDSEIIEKLDDFIKTFREQWYAENKTFGFSVQEIRLGGLRAA